METILAVVFGVVIGVLFNQPPGYVLEGLNAFLFSAVVMCGCLFILVRAWQIIKTELEKSKELEISYRQR